MSATVKNVKKTAKPKKNVTINESVPSVPAESGVPGSPKDEVAKVPKVPKKRASRAKKEPTKEETMALLLNASNEVKQVIQELKEDENKLSGLDLKKVPDLLKETIENLEEDLKEIDEQYEELKNYVEHLVQWEEIKE